MAWRTWVGGAVAVVLAAVAGCGPAKLNREVSFAVSDVATQAWGFDPQPVDQTFQVAVTSDQPVDVFVLAGTDENAATTMDSKDLEQKAVAAKRDVTQETLTAKIPAKQTAAVVVRIGQKRVPATGKVKITN